MHTGQKQFSILERFVVVAIILLVAAILIQKVLHTVKVSERRSLNNAAGQYEAVKSMYAEQRQIVPPGIVRVVVTDAANTYRAPVQ
jgi:type II secretory pathway pseudopilin PulG